jgi:hypothetical protein
VLVVAAVMVELVISTSSTRPSGSSVRSTTGSDVTTVQRRNLVETDTESGTLSYAGQHTIYNRLSGTVTWLPSVGQVIKRGQTLFTVDNMPVILLYGETPAYRDLDSSDSSGSDIRELNANLVALGENPDGIVVDDTWQAATTAGVDALQKALGETQTGKLSLGRVAFLPGKQLVNSVDSAVGSGNSGSSGSPGGSGNSGGSGGSPVAILHTSSTRLVATVDLAASSQSEAVVGLHVTVEMPNGSTVGGTITAVSPVASSSSSSGAGSGNGSSGSGSSGSGNSGSGSSGSSATVPVTITLDRRVNGGGLDHASVSVNFARARARNVLSVPVTALLATAGGGYSVQQAAAAHRLIQVTTGLFAAGYVQISGPGTYLGLQVTNSQG